jgi:SpoVK/Ycf46/Vps4 family AAA+-type ATPase
MDVFLAICAGKGLVLSTANKLQALPPELKRRFSLGTFYVDLPGAKEQAKIWEIWLKRYNMAALSVRPACVGWTGAEIRACCDIAFRTGMTLEGAAEFIVPVSKSSPESIAQLRTMANGKFIDAHRPGLYDMNRVDGKEVGSKEEKQGRRISV